MRTLIIQTSPPCTASTFLSNAVYGLIPELSDKKILGSWDEDWEQQFSGNILCIKCHNTNIDELICKYKENYNVFFVCSERPETNSLINSKYAVYKNVTIFQYKTLNETETNDVPNIINNIYEKINKMLNPEVGVNLSIKNGIDRINGMNERVKQIASLPFSYIDDFYEIHGSHRNRTKQDPPKDHPKDKEVALAPAAVSVRKLVVVKVPRPGYKKRPNVLVRGKTKMFL